MSEVFNLKKAIDRIVWRFSSGTFTPNQNDVEALKFLAEWINREKETELHKNNLFSKMYVYSLKYELQFYKDLDCSNKQLCDILQLPIQYHYDCFIKALNENELNNYSRKIGLSLKHPAIKTESEQQSDERITKENQSELSKYMLGVFNEREVYNDLNNQITECINRFKNLP